MRPVEFIIGWAAFVLGVLGALIAFQNFSAVIASRVLVTPFKVGTHTQQVLFRSKCLGPLTSTVDADRNEMKFELNFAVSNGSAIMPINANADCTTNNFHQMSRCQMLLKSKGQLLAKITLSGPAPIKAEIVSAAQLPLPTSLTFPGPIELSAAAGFLEIRGLNLSTQQPSPEFVALSNELCDENPPLLISELTSLVPTFGHPNLSEHLELQYDQSR